MKYKNLIFLIIFIVPVVSLCQSFHKLTHYNIVNSNLKVYNINDRHFILAGSKGGVLRTSSSGENWEQTYSGTDADIVQVRQNESDIYAITIKGEFMKSTDGGDNWSVKKISNSPLVDFYIEDNLIYLCKFTDSIMISSDFGDNWVSKFAISDTIQNIFVQEGKIVLNTLNNNLKIFENEVWKTLPLPGNLSSNVSYKVINKKSGFYTVGNNNVSRLNENFKWVSYLIKDYTVSDILETKNQLITINSNQAQERIDIVYYKKLDMTIEKTEAIQDSNLSLHHYSVKSADIDESGNIIVSAPGKTIFINNPNSRWKTKSAFIITTLEGFWYNRFYTSDEWRFTSSKGVYLWTNDGGTTFGKGTRSVENLKTKNVEYITKDSINLSITDSEFNYASSSDAGKTFDFKNIDSPYTAYNLFSKFKNFTVYNKQSYKNQSFNNPFIIFLKETDGKVDTLFELDSVFISNTLYYKDKILIIEELNKNQEFNFQLTDINLKNPKKVFSLKVEYDESKSNKARIKTVLVNDIGNIYVVVERWPISTSYIYNSIYKITDFEKEPELVFAEKPIYFYFPSNYSIDDKEKIVTIAKSNEDSTGLEFFYCKLDFSNGFEYEIQGNSDVQFMTAEYTQDNETFLFQRSPNDIWRPIEADRISTLVETEPTPPVIWTDTPFPNPTTNLVRIPFFSGLMHNIALMQVNIINISTGVSKSIVPSNIISENNWHGLIELDLSEFPTGSYLLEFNLNNKKSIEKLIITR